MVYYGHGLTWTEIYNMPVWLRKFYYKKMEEAALKDKKNRENATKNTKSPNIAKPKVPKISKPKL